MCQNVKKTAWERQGQRRDFQYTRIGTEITQTTYDMLTLIVSKTSWLGQGE